MNYIGEATWIGEAGRIFTSLAFVTALVSAFFYYLTLKSQNIDYQKTGRILFYLHTFSVVAIVALMLVMLTGHYFEYDYAWKHTSRNLETKYIFSAFWEGQEGSFILWIFWHAMLFLIFPLARHRFEAPVLMIGLLVQTFLISMILGIYPFGVKIGSSPFVLIRELPENIGLPWTKMEDYLQKLPGFMEGRGLNPLLQNYWMTIHPPTLFLGFASTVIPFAFALGSLIQRDYKGWLKPALPWTYFALGILGAGILMGGAWAYESLSFGGFWAWDPVENASLVPWLTLAASAHLMMIAINKGTALRTSYWMLFLTYFFILYSTFLTRSGVLGDASVHSFVDLGLNGQLLALLFFFLLLPFLLFAFHYKWIPDKTEDETLYSREFWMFVGALILLVSGFQIIFSTSIPVINKLIGPDGLVKLLPEKLAPPVDAIKHYNSFQLPFAIIITLFMAFGQFLSYRQKKANQFWKNISLSIAVSVLLSLPFILLFKMWKHPLYSLLTFTSALALVSNLDFWLRIVRGNWAVSGASIAHAGFGLMMLGTVVSQANQKIITKNKTYIAENIPASENILMEKGDTLVMEPYLVTWSDTWQENHRRYYKVDFLKENDGQLAHAFTVVPHIQINDRMGLVAEPGTKHYLHKDIYTFLSYASDVQNRNSPDGFGDEMEFMMARGDTFIVDRYFMVLDSIIANTSRDPRTKEIKTIEIEAVLKLISATGNRYEVRPKYYLDESNVVNHIDAVSEEAGIKVRFKDINQEQNKLVFTTWKKLNDGPDFIIMKAIVFPAINLLWTGIVMMTLGIFLSVYQRYKIQRR
ncbi:cytochrome c assembly protein [Thermaurantimonas aggregans]|uniref:Cytochrome c assembly protein n=1 Tax=Thermaurantimonas aggregans TaxID=2173829 RepID=A0A401XIE7_9FLAO|nr:cytochrome c biogenesis protein CcsA [Thermaurantimonas aggregans]MCX8149079.1 cytochrome c biogenesis protein CcsA [Thermaurantimonas aggregans]GCD76771.1 cytochrome c assembly protein [Thermaurantimonas aggregans]